MKYILSVFLCLLFFSYTSWSQSVTGSSIQKSDSALRQNAIKPPNGNFRKINKDSITAIQVRRSMDRIENLFRSQSLFPVFKQPIILLIQPRKEKDDDVFFYFLTGLILYFALIRIIFGRYLDNLISLFFRVTMRHQQIREQLLQTPLPSLLLNILFVISGGMYLSFLSAYYGLAPDTNFWIVFLYCVTFITLVYISKYIFLKMIGWIFGVTTATDTYIFIVFLVNKMMGILLLPFLVLMAFPHFVLYPVAVVLSYLLLILLFVYRFFISYRPIRNEIKVNKSHFFIYLCAFEIAPLLLIYKVLLDFVERST